MAVRVTTPLPSASAPAGSEPPPPAQLFTRQFGLACAMHFAGGMAMSLGILLPLFIRHLGGTEVTIGVYAGIGGAAAVLARIPVARLLDTQGRRRVITAAAALEVLGWVGFTRVTHLGWASVLLAATMGLAGGSLFASFLTYANDIVPTARRSEGIAMFGVWGILPNGLGPALGEFLIQRTSYTVYFLAAAGFAALALAVCRLLPETAPALARRAVHAAPEPVSVFPWAAIAFALGVTFVFGAAVNSLFTFLAPFAQAAGRGSVGQFFMSYSLSAVAVRVFAGRLPDRIGLQPVLVPALASYALGLLLVPHVAAPHGLVAAGVLCGIGHGYAFPILNVLTMQRVTAAHRGRAVTWFTAMFDLGNSLANPLLGAVAHVAGYTAMFTTVGLATLATTWVVWRRPPSR